MLSFFLTFLFFQDVLVHPPAPQPQTFFLSFKQSIPKEVWQAKEQSMVAVEVKIPRWDWDHNIFEESGGGVGVTVWPNHVLMPLHLLGDYPALWDGNKDFPTAISVFDGAKFFETSLIDYNYKMDLALVKVTSPDQDGKVFQSKPIKRSKTTMLLDPNLSEPSILYNKFYAFSFFAHDPLLFFALELGPFRAITNNFDDGYLLDVPMGMIQGTLQPGFSGSPLFTPDGVLFGMMVRGKQNNFSFVVLPETIEKFLKMAGSRSGLDAEGRPLPIGH